MPNPTGTINADEDHSGKTITNVPDPSAAQDVATKAYADSVGSGGVNSFGTIVVAGQSNVVADTAPDTLTLVAGTNVTLTTNASTDTVTIAATGGGGSGDVVGPGSATDNAIARFDSTTGKLIQNSALTVSDTGAITFPAGIRQTFDPNGTTPGINVGAIAGDPNTPSNGDLWYDSTANELTARVNGANVTLGGGTVTNVATLTTGKLVVGASGSTINVSDLTGDVTTSGGVATTLAAGNAGNLNSGTLSAARMPALTGDVTTSAGAVATTIANDAVTYAKMQNVSAASKLLGRGDSGSGDVEQITLGANLTMTGTTLDTTAGSAGVSDAAYDSSWNGVTGTAPSKNAVYDALQTIGSGGATTVKVASSNFTNSSTSLVNITGLTFAASANKLYEVECTIKMRSSQSGGTNFAVAYSAAGATAMCMNAGGATTTQGLIDVGTLGVAPDTQYGQTVDTDTIVKMWAVVTIGANTGNITIQTKQNTGGTGTVFIGSRMTVTELA